MIHLTINNRKIQAEEDATVLDAARKNGMDIPTLCHHPALEPQGMCRLCTVEVVAGKRRRFVTACNYPVSEGLEVFTHSEEVLSARRTIIELLWARCPDVEVIRDLAGELGVDRPRFRLEDDACILCGLCVRMCEERMGRSAISLVGRGVDLKVDTPFHIQTDVCMACGACVSVCPTGVLELEQITRHKPAPIASEFDEGLRPRSPVYLPYLQAVPNVPVIDREKCIHFKTGACGICRDVCEADAIDFQQQDEVMEVEVGSIILSPGFDEFKVDSDHLSAYGYTSIISQYGYDKYPDVVTSIEFERILSASGPFQGHLARPSDGKPPRKIAWLQCVGSRDVTCDSGYCSSVCCMYAVKEAVIAKEHSVDPVDVTIFYMDMRSHGKGFDRYVERAKEQHGVRFVRAKIYGVEERSGNGDLSVRYATEGGAPEREAFDMVVLSVGMKPRPGAVDLAERLGIERNAYGFCETRDFSPMQTSREGVFVCGAFQGPKDIPDTVMQASGAAASSAALLAEARGERVRKREFPSETVVTGEPPRIGVFVCHCGINIGGVVNVPEVKAYAASLPGVVYVNENLYTCSQDTQEGMKQRIEEHRLNRVVVASCSPRTHEPLFQETLQEQGMNKHLFEMANIRDQCSWVHQQQPGRATGKAKDLVRMAVARARLAEPLEPIVLRTLPSALVIGGGIAGMEAALNLAEQGFEVHLLEKAMSLGGIGRKVFHTLNGRDVQAYLKGLTEKVMQHPSIEVHTRAVLVESSGYIGNFTTRIKSGSKKEPREIRHGVVLIATGGEEFKTQEYLYKKNRRVLSLLDLEKEVVKHTKRIKDCRNLVMIQCVGSRNEENPTCSKVCCSASIKCALSLKKLQPETNVYILYRDVRTYGFKEDFFREAREEGVVFIRYEPESGPRVHPEKEGGQEVLRVTVEDPILKETLVIDADLLALALATVPPSTNKDLSRLFKVPLDQDGFFLEAHMKLRPVEFATDGIFMCGLAHGPKFIEESIAQARAAASRAASVLSREVVELPGTVSFVDERRCAACGACEGVCPFGAVEVHGEKGHAVVNDALCKGCGVCAASCPSGAINLYGFSNSQILSAIDSF